MLRCRRLGSEGSRAELAQRLGAFLASPASFPEADCRPRPVVQLGGRLFAGRQQLRSHCQLLLALLEGEEVEAGHPDWAFLSALLQQHPRYADKVGAAMCVCVCGWLHVVCGVGVERSTHPPLPPHRLNPSAACAPPAARRPTARRSLRPCSASACVRCSSRTWPRTACLSSGTSAARSGPTSRTASASGEVGARGAQGGAPPRRHATGVGACLLAPRAGSSSACAPFPPLGCCGRGLCFCSVEFLPTPACAAAAAAVPSIPGSTRGTTPTSPFATPCGGLWVTSWQHTGRHRRRSAAVGGRCGGATAAGAGWRTAASCGWSTRSLLSTRWAAAGVTRGWGY